MSEPSKQEQDRWRELHELLGLPGREPAAPPAPTKPPPLPAEPPHVKHAEYAAAEPPLPETIDDIELPPPALEAGMASDADRTLSAPEEEEIPEALDEEAPLPPRKQNRDESRGDDDRPRRGRRRGRRGRRSGSRRPDDAVERMDTDDTEVESTDEGPQTPAHGADVNDDGEPDETAIEEDEAAAPAPAAAEDDDDEPIETFADWNVPSWQDIVASLYRPDR